MLNWFWEFLEKIKFDWTINIPILFTILGSVFWLGRAVFKKKDQLSYMKDAMKGYAKDWLEYSKENRLSHNYLKKQESKWLLIFQQKERINIAYALVSSGIFDIFILVEPYEKAIGDTYILRVDSKNIVLYRYGLMSLDNDFLNECGAPNIFTKEMFQNVLRRIYSTEFDEILQGKIPFAENDMEKSQRLKEEEKRKG